MKHPIAQIIIVATATFVMLYWLFNKQLTKDRVSKAKPDPILLKYKALNKNPKNSPLSTTQRFSVHSKDYFFSSKHSIGLNLKNQNDDSDPSSNVIEAPTISEIPDGSRLINEKNFHFDGLQLLEKPTSGDTIDEKPEIINLPNLSDTSSDLINSYSNLPEDLNNESITGGYYTPQLSPSPSMQQLPVIQI